MKLFILTFTIFSSLSSAVFAEQDSLLSVIDYKGGFTKDLKGIVENKDLLKSFRVAIPDFCKDVEIVEAATVTEGVRDEAKLVDAKAHIYSINGGTGQRIGQILLTLNGPSTSACQIPILANEISPTPKNVKVELCNRTNDLVYAALGYIDDSGKAFAKGWYPIAPNSCERPELEWKYKDAVYTFAMAPTTGMTWGNDLLFCTHVNLAFSTDDAPCLSGNANYVWRRFSKWKFQPQDNLKIAYQ